MRDEYDKNQRQARNPSQAQEHIVPEREASLDEELGDPFQGTRKRRWSILRLALIGLGLAGILLVLYVTVITDGEADGPALEIRVQQQQRIVDRLRAQINALQQDREDRDAGSQRMERRLDTLDGRLDAQESDFQAPERQQLPETVAALSRRLDTLSSSINTRFSAIQAKESILPSIFIRARKHQSSQMPAAQGSASKSESKPKPKPKPKAKRRYTPPSPPFTVSGLEMRGGRRFLTIMVGNAGRLSDLRLVGEGQHVGRWRLASIAGHSAAFTVNGKTVVVPVP